MRRGLERDGQVAARAQQPDVQQSVKQAGTIASHASEATRAAIWIALLTGCRRGEVLSITPQDIGPDSITIRVGNTKTLRARTVPNVPAVRPWLAQVPLPLTFEGLKSGFRRAREAAGMPHAHYHDLRHSCATAAPPFCCPSAPR